MSANNGGPAFPHEDGQFHGANDSGSHGMTLRDWFAGMALQGELSKMGADAVVEGRLARWCYEMADAMIAERSKQ